MFTDSHCHLSFPELQAQLPSILAAMAQAKVDRALCICTTLEEFEDVHGLARDNANLWCTVGVHPDNEGVQEPSLDDLLTRAGRPKVVGIGETGLDYYRLGERTVSDMAWQRERYLTHIRAGREIDLPLVIHTRSASDDTLAILRESGGFQSGGETASTQARSRGVFHCFTETSEVARAALDMDFYISFSGIITFRSGSICAHGAPADRNRQPLLGTCPVPWQDQYPCLRSACGPASGRDQRAECGAGRCSDQPEF
jgi:TatD DNase family protein